MTNILITCFVYVFDLFLILTFYNNTLQYRKENVPGVIFYGSYCIMEVILFVNENATASLPENRRYYITVLVSFLTLYALAFLYQISMRHRLFSAMIFQVLAILGETVFTMLMQMIRPSIFSISDSSLIIIMNLGSKVVLFVLALMVSIFWKGRFYDQSLNYHVFILSTPLISLIVMLLTPIEDIIIGNNRTFFLCLYLSLALLNIINYWLLNKVFRQEQALHRMHQMEMQIAYQKERYIQLGTAYKTNRRLIHDTKKHYFILQEHLKRKEYEELYQYLQLSMKDIENTYTEINTGNLVIDSFVSNFKNLAQEDGIRFSTTLQIDAERIPVNDYDLCVVFGNLLDNSFNACKKNLTGQNYIMLTVSINENDIFYIHIENTYDHSEKPDSPKKSDFLKHGYGMDNIHNIIENYHGFVKYEFTHIFIMDIVVPIIDEKKRFHPPHKTHPRPL